MIFMICVCQETSDLTANKLTYGTFNGTTDIGGDCAIPDTHIDNIFIVGVWCPGVSYTMTPKAVSGGGWYVNVQKYDTNTGELAVVKNTAITGRYYYFNL